MNKYYVYIHRKKSDGSAFYVGKGCGKRAYKNSNRSERWKAISNKYGLVVEIYKDSLDENSALLLEQVLIKEYGRLDLGTGCLVNFTDGGDTTNLSKEARKKISDSAKNRRHSQETLQKMSRNRTNIFRDTEQVYSIAHLDGREITATFPEIITQVGREFYTNIRHIISQRVKLSSGWFLNNGKLNISKRDCDTTIYEFVSSSDVIRCTKRQFKNQTGISTSLMFTSDSNQSSRIIKGWLVNREDITLEECRKIITKLTSKPTYSFLNTRTAELFEGTVKDFAIYSKIKQSSLCDLFRKNSHGSVRGWTIKETHDRN